jgi:hypothetical protein
MSFVGRCGPDQFKRLLRRLEDQLYAGPVEVDRGGRLMDQARKAIAKLLGPMLDHDFLRNCQDESLFERASLESMLMNLHELTFRPKLGQLKKFAAPTFVSLH